MTIFYQTIINLNPEHPKHKSINYLHGESIIYGTPYEALDLLKDELNSMKGKYLNSTVTEMDGIVTLIDEEKRVVGEFFVSEIDLSREVLH